MPGQHLFRQHLSISGLYQLLLTQFFKGRLLETSRTDSKCHGNFCPGSICPSDFWPYKPWRLHHKLLLSLSQLLLNQFWQNVKGRSLETSRTDSKCHCDICPGNICPCNICPYKEYISCYWLDFDQTLRFFIPSFIDANCHETFVLATYMRWRHLSISAISLLLLLTWFWPTFFDPIFWGPLLPLFWTNLL